MAVALRKDEASFVDALPYWEIEDGAVVLEDGVLEVGLEVQLPSTLLSATSTVESLHGSIVGLLRNVVPQKERLRLLVEAAPMRAGVLERYRNALTSTHPAAAFLSEEKTRFFEQARRNGKLIEYRAYLTCTYTPPGRRRRRQARSSEEFRRHHIRALEIRERMLTALAKAGFEPTPLFDQGLFELMWRYFNPASREGRVPSYFKTEVHYPKHVLKRFPHLAPPTLRSQLLGSDLARRWDYLWLSGHFARMVSMGNLPTGHTQGGMVGHLLSVPRLYWLMVDYVHEPYGPALRSLMAQARRLHSATGDTGGLTDYADPTVRVGFKEVDEALSHMSETGTHVFRVGLSLLLLDSSEDGIQQGMQEARAAFTNLPSVQPIVETAGLLTQFTALAPCSGQTTERVFLTLEENAADFFPLDGPWRGSSQPVSLLWDRWDSLTAIDPFDPKGSNWNGIVIGGSGSGKTFLMQTLLGDLLRKGADVIIVDRGYGYQQLVELFGGETIPIEPGSGVSINPFELPEGVSKPDDQKKGFLLAVLRTMLPSEGGVTASLENAILTSAISQTYAKSLNGQPQQVCLSTFADVLSSLTVIGKREATAKERELAQSLALRLEHWTGDSAFGSFIDRPTTVFPDAPILYYETTGLERFPDLRTVGLLLITDLIWRRVTRDLSRKKIVVLDEVWSLLKLPQAASFVVELYRRFRRYNAAAYAVTQSLEDFQSEAARGILQNTTYHYLLRLATEDDLIQRLLNLPDRAMAAFRSLSSKKGSYSEALAWIRQEDGLTGGVIVLRPSPVEYWAYTTNAEDMALRETILETHGGELIPALTKLARDYPYGVAGG